MAASTNQEPSILAVLDAWRDWTSADTTERPRLGKLLGEGSANRVYELQPMRHKVLRIAQKSHEVSVNRSLQEIVVWKFVANEGLAPTIHYHSDRGDVVVTDRLSFDGVSADEHANLLMRIHRLQPSASRLLLTDVAETYRAAAVRANSFNTAIDLLSEPIKSDLEQLDSESPVFCHNDLSTENIGWLGERLLAIDWEYAAMGSPHFDVASASEGYTEDERRLFAMSALENAFDEDLWAAASRAAPLISFLWASATNDQETAESLRGVIEGHYLT